MKIAFDENIPIAMVRVFQTFAKERRFKHLSGGHSIESAQDYAPKPGDTDYEPKNDVPWIKRFAEAGGQVIISGNTKMRRTPHERLALVEAGMVVVFFENQWSQWKFFRKCALLLNWWPTIIKQLKTAKPKTFLCVPSAWPEKGKLRQVSSDDLKLQKIQRQKAAQKDIQAARQHRRKALLQPKQIEMTFGCRSARSGSYRPKAARRCHRAEFRMTRSSLGGS